MDVPEYCRPRAPAPPHSRIEAAALEICEAMASDYFGGSNFSQRSVNLRHVASWLQRRNRDNPTPADDYRWAAKLMIEAGLVECMEYKSTPAPDPDEFFERPFPQQPPEFFLVSKPELWKRRRLEAPILGTDVAGFRIRFNSGNRSLWLDDRLIASNLDEEVFDYMKVLVSSYPDPISYKGIRKQSPLLPENQSRFNTRVDRALSKLLKFLTIERESSRGHLLKRISE
jgi:hypothetical protein